MLLPPRADALTIPLRSVSEQTTSTSRDCPAHRGLVSLVFFLFKSRYYLSNSLFISLFSIDIFLVFLLVLSRLLSFFLHWSLSSLSISLPLIHHYTLGFEEINRRPIHLGRQCHSLWSIFLPDTRQQKTANEKSRRRLILIQMTIFDVSKTLLIVAVVH